MQSRVQNITTVRYLPEVIYTSQHSDVTHSG